MILDNVDILVWAKDQKAVFISDLYDASFFTDEEILTGEDEDIYIDDRIGDAIRYIFDTWGPMKFGSVFRSPDWEESKGRGRVTPHSSGLAFDLVPTPAFLKSMSQYVLSDKHELPFRVGLAKDHIHIDFVENRGKVFLEDPVTMTQVKEWAGSRSTESNGILLLAIAAAFYFSFK